MNLFHSAISKAAAFGRITGNPDITRKRVTEGWPTIVSKWVIQLATLLRNTTFIRYRRISRTMPLRGFGAVRLKNNMPFPRLQLF
jgi:hypothetical protein